MVLMNHGQPPGGGGGGGHRPPITGTWVMCETSSLSSHALATALSVPDIRGLSLRVPWIDVATDFSVVAPALALCRQHRVAFALRVVSGHNTPPADMGNHISVGGVAFPLPWGAGTAPGHFVPNAVFEAAYHDLCTRLRDFANTNADVVAELHMSWFGGATGSEVWLEPPLTTDPAYTVANALEGYTRLFDIAYPIIAAAGIPMEFPLSGKGEGIIQSPLGLHMVSTAGPNNPHVITQWNSLTDTGPRVNGVPGIQHARQMAHPVAYNWQQVYAILKGEHAIAVEVYLQEFGLAGASDLIAQIPTFP